MIWANCSGPGEKDPGSSWNLLNCLRFYVENNTAVSHVDYIFGDVCCMVGNLFQMARSRRNKTVSTGSILIRPGNIIIILEYIKLLLRR